MFRSVQLNWSIKASSMLALKELETRFKVQTYNASTDVTVNYQLL